MTAFWVAWWRADHSRPARALRLAVLVLLVGWAAVAGAGPATGEATPASAATAVRVVVRLDGLSDEALTNVRAALELLEYTDTTLAPMRARWLFSEGSEQIRAALRPLGFYRPKVAAELEEAGADWVARYRVELGEPVPITALHLQLRGAGAKDPEVRDVWKRLPLDRGEPARHDRYSAAKRALSRLAAERGYLDAEFSRSALVINVERYDAQVWLHWDTGRRYRFGAVEFAQVPLNLDLLERFVPFRPGQAYTQAQVLRLQERLVDSGYFSSVEVIPTPRADGTAVVDVQVHLKMRRRNRYLGGIGYGTDTGPRLRAGLERRYVNRAGHRFEVDAMASEVISNFESIYKIPLAEAATDSLQFQFGWHDEQSDAGIAESWSIGTAVEHAGDRWRRVLGLAYERERFTVGQDEGLSQLLIPSLSLTRVRADRAVHPRRGLRQLVELRGSVEGPVSDTSFVQLRLFFKGVQPLGRGRWIWRTELGASWVDEFDELPLSVRFFAGGDQSVRGYGYKSLGPADGTEVVGGRHLLVSALEYEYPLNPNWYGAVFTDAGNAFDGTDVRLHQSIGIGIRRRLPVGAIRLDLAHPEPIDDWAWRIHFSLGPDL